MSATPPWKSRFYEAYVSSGQSIDTGGTAEALFRPRKAFLTHIIAQHMPRDTTARILEVACGPGALLYFLEQAGYRNIAGVDVSEEQIAVAARLGILSASCSTLEDFLGRQEAGSADRVLAIDILEHLPREEIVEILVAIRRVLKPGARESRGGRGMVGAARGGACEGYHRFRQGRCPGNARRPLHDTGAAGQQPGGSREAGDCCAALRTTRRTMRRFISFRDFDWLLLAMVLLLSIISILEIYSATLHTKFVGFETKQIFWLIGGLAAMFLFSLINYHRLLEAVHWVYGFCLISLVAVLIFGTKVMGGRRWIKLPGGIHFQPSEWVKVVLIVAMARYFAGLAGRDLTWSDIFKAFLMVGLPMLLVLKQPDLGTSLTYIPVLIVGLFLGGLEWKKGVILVVAGLVLVVPVWAKVLKPTRSSGSPAS